MGGPDSHIVFKSYANRYLPGFQAQGKAKPDLIWTRDGQVLLVGDVKFKRNGVETRDRDQVNRFIDVARVAKDNEGRRPGLIICATDEEGKENGKETPAGDNCIVTWYVNLNVGTEKVREQLQEVLGRMYGRYCGTLCPKCGSYVN